MNPYEAVFKALMIVWGSAGIVVGIYYLVNWIKR